MKVVITIVTWLAAFGIIVTSTPVNHGSPPSTSSSSSSCQKKIQSYGYIAKDVCKAILLDIRGTSTASVTSTATVSSGISTILTSTTVTVSPTVTVTTTSTSGVPLTTTTTVTSTSTSSTTLLATIAPSSTPRKRDIPLNLVKRQSPLASIAAREVLLIFGPIIPRAVCIQLLYGGISSKAPAPTTRTTTVITSTSIPVSSTTMTVTSSTTALTSTVTNTAFITPSAVISTVTVSTTTSATVFQFIPALATDSATFCGPNADAQGCSCTTDPSGLSVQCNYQSVQTAATFIAPCYGTLAASLQGAQGGQNVGGSHRQNRASGSSVESADIGNFDNQQQFIIHVGGGGGDANDGFTGPETHFDPTGGTGGYNGGGAGGAGHYFSAGGGGGGATDIFLQGGLTPLLAAGGAGGSGPNSAGMTPNSADTSTQSSPQGDSDSADDSGGGGGGGGFPGGAAGGDDTGGFGGTSKLSSLSDIYIDSTDASAASATLSFTCQVQVASS